MPTPVLPAGVRLYEAMWIVDANSAREDYNKCLAGIKEVIEKGGGSYINGDKWEERKLAYPIRKKKRGLYIITHFSAPTDAIIKIDRAAKLSDLIVRHMILVDQDGLTTSPPVRTLEDEDFRGRFRWRRWRWRRTPVLRERPQLSSEPRASASGPSITKAACSRARLWSATGDSQATRLPL